MMVVLCDRLRLCSTTALDCRTGQNKGRYRKQERSFFLVWLHTMNVFVGHSTELIFTPLCMEKRPEAKNDLYYSELERKQTRLLGDMTSLFLHICP